MNVLRARTSSADASAPRVSSPSSRARALLRPRAAARFCRGSRMSCMLSGADGSCAAQPRCAVHDVRSPCAWPRVPRELVCVFARAHVLSRILTLCLVSLSSTPVVIPRCGMCLVYARDTALLSAAPPCLSNLLLIRSQELGEDCAVRILLLMLHVG